MRGIVIAAGAGLCTAMSANAFVSTMYNVGFDPASVGTLVQSLDVANTSYQFTVPTGTTNSGFLAEIIVGGVPVAPDPGVSPNTTSIVSEVFSLDSPVVLNDPIGGPLTLDAGDLIFSYTIRLTGANGNTVNSVSSFEVQSRTPTFPGGTNSDIFDASVVNGRGFGTTGLTAATTGGPADIDGSGDLTAVPGFASSLDFDWANDFSTQLQNGESIRLLMFTENVPIEQGFGELTAPPGQTDPDTARIANAIPVLVPVIPAPASLTLLAIAGTAASRRRR